MCFSLIFSEQSNIFTVYKTPPHQILMLSLAFLLFSPRNENQPSALSFSVCLSLPRLLSTSLFPFSLTPYLLLTPSKTKQNKTVPTCYYPTHLQPLLLIHDTTLLHLADYVLLSFRFLLRLDFTWEVFHVSSCPFPFQPLSWCRQVLLLRTPTVPTAC